MSNRQLNILVLLAVFYVAAQMLADVTSLRILFIAGLSIDGGTLIYPFTFTLRDLVHKATNKQIARTLIFAAAGINILMAFLFWVVAELPADGTVGSQVEFAVVLAPVWRIVIASIVAEVVAELIDGEVYERWVNRFADKHQWARVMSSNAISVPIDSALFVIIAFIGVLPTSVIWSIFAANVLVKSSVTFLSTPWIYLVKPPQLLHKLST
ncbi:queuosine precursor transporter [Candidatus Uhrbacteria bacterium]|nr:queuosine precursor transporter [Candidatus Uhrbacteria bacterium]